MSEYWKSTPKYWCKFCSDYIKDTKFERAQHEATARHQGNIQRQLKGLHREQANKAREQQRAKDEVARLNGLVPSSGTGAAAGSVAAGAAGSTPTPTYKKAEERKATLQDRKRQWEQLAAMGIAPPDEATKGKTVKGEWTVVSEKVVGEVGSDGVEREVEEKGQALNKGVRKRKLDDEEVERIQDGETITKKKGWGEKYKTFPGKRMGGGEEDLDALFNIGKQPKVEEEEAKAEIKEDDVKGEEVQSSVLDIPTAEEAAAKSAVKEEEDKAVPAVVFKKRKKIAK
ncbi:hypothetical protein P280DRAFT_51524 [Massarina eburnea CBS 473.64]|uniref:U1-type domain-containing protein n=1 Tax=Massarina eburnea CBS 473.64 TaxID=1395130 RepID=A0A6A6S0C4_9PLEO|nr:hypothetical protein P280DRAFT_51524 [Massarina eburnea CBS 473.64]